MDDAQRNAMADIAGDAMLAGVYRVWDEKRRERFAPGPADIGMLDLPPSALGNIIIMDVLRGGERFRFRLIGSKIAASSGSDFTGKYVDEALSGWMRDTVQEQYRTIVTQKRPGYAVVAFGRGDQRESVRNRRLAMPLSSDGVTVDRLLLVSKASSTRLLQEDLLNLALNSEPLTVRSFIML